MPKIPNQLISIVVPVFKSERFLDTAIQSLISQSYDNIEILLINDGSPDGSGKICESYGKKDRRIKTIHQKNKGAAHAMLNGALLSSGEFLMFMDGDDWIEPNTCAEAIKAVVEHDADVVFWSYFKNGKDGQKTIEPFFQNDTIFEGESLLTLKRRLTGMVGSELNQPTKTDAISSGWGKLYQRDLIVNHPTCLVDRNNNDNLDLEMNIVVFRNVHKAVYLRKHFNHYRVDNQDSLSKNYGNGLIEKYLSMFANIEIFLRENDYPPIFFEALNNRVSLSIINNVLSITSSRNKIGSRCKIRAINELVNNNYYKKSLEKFKLTHLPLPWKIFFLFCKNRFILGIFLLTQTMRTLRFIDRKKRQVNLAHE